MSTPPFTVARQYRLLRTYRPRHRGGAAMTTYPTPVKIAAGPLYDALRLQNVLTIETVEAALHEHVYKLWEERGMFGADDDLDLACEILDAARHAITDPGRRIDKTMQALLTADAGRLVREWEARKKSRLDPTPTSVRVHEHNQTRQGVAR